MSLYHIVFISLFIHLLACQEVTTSSSKSRQKGKPNHQAQSESEVTPHNLTLPERRVIKIFKTSSPSVVHITSMSLTRSRFDFSFYEREEGTGTGFIWDEQGHIVTNYHVIKQGNMTQVALTLSKEDLTKGESQGVFEARVIGIAPDRDLAVLSIQAPKKLLKPLPMGKSSTLLVGQGVLAIGNPFGFDQTLTTGIISGLGREIKSVTQRKIKGAIQTDAAINPGNSGGPLLDSSGKLIGVNTAIYSPSGAYAGIGFAVPVDTVKRVVPQLIKYGGEVKPSLGVEVEEGRLAQRYDFPGTLITKVEPNSLAEKKGLKGLRWSRRGLLWGDIILSIEGKKTPNAETLYQILDEFKLGQKVSLLVQQGFGRHAKRKTIELVLTGVVEQ